MVALGLRMVLYAVFAGMAGYGVGEFNAETGNFTVNADELLQIGIGAVGYVGTFIVSRRAKAQGGVT